MKGYIVSALMALAFHISAQTKQVSNPAALKAAVSMANPGDVIILADGEWRDADLVLQGKGSAAKPVIIRPQTPGGVTLTGTSSLRIGGEYLIVKDLHFTNGNAGNRDVVTFKTDNDHLANHCRITGIVIDHYSQPERFKNDNWVVLWGKNNRVDHCTFENKMNAGPTLIVELNDERSQENYHSIDSNYFKGRHRLGSNGGETMRIGVSRYSLTASRTKIVYNYFERCNGEVEVVSVKSGENQVSFNTFFECEGSLVLRHGSKNIVEGNLFLGNEKPFTGGVRVINPGHKVFNNIFIGLRGAEFRAPLAVMNGVPNSLINRYYQVKDADIHHNTFINCSSILFGVGRDAERTLAPENVLFRNNLIVAPPDPIYKDSNGGKGIFFTNNGVSGTGVPVPGFTDVKVKSKKVRLLELVPPVSGRGADLRNLPLTGRSAAGAKWWNPQAEKTGFKAKQILVPASESDRLPEIIAGAAPGDTIVLNEKAYYAISKELQVTKPLVITAAAGLQEKPVLVNKSARDLPGFLVIGDGGKLIVKGIAFAGTYENYGPVGAGIITTSKPMINHYTLKVDDCRFYDFNESSYAGIKALKSTYADTIEIRNSLFRNLSGNGIDLSAEKDDKGTYNAEYTIIENCVFTNILGSALNLYRGGNDESTLGPFLTIDHCTFNEVDNREQGAVLRLLGVQNASITNSVFAYSGQGGRSVHFQESRYDKIKVDYCMLYRSGRIESFYNKAAGKNIYEAEPLFTDAKSFNFNLKPGSFLAGSSSDGNPPGARL